MLYFEISTRVKTFSNFKKIIQVLKLVEFELNLGLLVALMSVDKKLMGKLILH